MKDVIYMYPTAMAFDIGDAHLVGIKRGEAGYWAIYSQATPDELNGEVVPDNVKESAITASTFGWHVPAANAANDWFDAKGVN